MTPRWDVERFLRPVYRSRGIVGGFLINVEIQIIVVGQGGDSPPELQHGRTVNEAFDVSAAAW